MAETEGIERESHEEEEEGEVEEEVSEGEVLDLWYKVNNEVTLHQPELCAIYTAVYWAWKPDGNPWNGRRDQVNRWPCHTRTRQGQVPPS